MGAGRRPLNGRLAQHAPWAFSGNGPEVARNEPCPGAVPALAAAFEAGELSWDKLRACVEIADEETDGHTEAKALSVAHLQASAKEKGSWRRFHQFTASARFTLEQKHPRERCESADGFLPRSGPS